MSGDDLTIVKEDIRREYRERRHLVPDDVGHRASRVIVEQLVELLAPYDAVAGYMSHENEVDLRQLWERLLDDGAHLFLPRVAGPGEMDFVAITDLSELRPGAYGILEPSGAAAPLEDIEVFLIPGVAFDRHGVRMGFGGGYYDRALSEVRPPEPSLPSFIGIAYQWQIHDEPLPCEPHDIRMDMVVTEEQVLRFD